MNETEQPLDLDGDGLAESVGIDTDGDAAPEMIVTTDSEGTTVINDSNNDGVFDQAIEDVGSDGTVDHALIDRDYNGTFETEVGPEGVVTTGEPLDPTTAPVVFSEPEPPAGPASLPIENNSSIYEPAPAGPATTEFGLDSSLSPGPTGPTTVEFGLGSSYVPSPERGIGLEWSPTFTPDNPNAVLILDGQGGYVSGGPDAPAGVSVVPELRDENLGYESRFGVGEAGIDPAWVWDRAAERIWHQEFNDDLPTNADGTPWHADQVLEHMLAQTADPGQRAQLGDYLAQYRALAPGA